MAQAETLYSGIKDMASCPQCETVVDETEGPGRILCPRCGFRFCSECYYYRHRLNSDFCLVCGASFASSDEARRPALPDYLEQHVARSVSLINFWFLAWLALSIGGGASWLYGVICVTLGLYWFIHFLLFRRRTGLVYAAHYIGGVGASVTVTMVLLVVFQFWLIRPPIDWRSIDLWAFLLAAFLIIPVGVFWLPATIQSRFGTHIATEFSTYAARWKVLERMRYRDIFLLRFPDVRHLAAVSQHRDRV